MILVFAYQPEAKAQLQDNCARRPVASFTKEINSRLAKRPLVFNFLSKTVQQDLQIESAYISALSFFTIMEAFWDIKMNYYDILTSIYH